MIGKELTAILERAVKALERAADASERTAKAMEEQLTLSNRAFDRMTATTTTAVPIRSHQ